MFESTCLEDGVKYALQTANKFFQDDTLVWRTRWNEFSLYPFVGNFSSSIVSIPLTDIFAELLFNIIKNSTIL